MGYSGLVFTRPGVKNLIVEVKRPGALAWIERSAVQGIDAHCIQNWKIWRDLRGVSMAPTLANIRYERLMTKLTLWLVTFRR